MGKGSYITQVPLTIPSCIGWMDAADLSTITSSGGSVSSVRNKANSLIPFVQATGAKQPITGTRTINGNNTLDFNSAALMNLTANGLAAYLTGSDKPFTVFSVCQCDTPNTTQNTVWSINSTSTNTPFHSQVYQTGNLTSSRRDDANTIVNTSAPYIAGVNINTIIFTGTDISSYTNTTTNYTNTAMNVGTLTLNSFGVGATTRTSDIYGFDGAIGEVIIYSRALSASERLDVDRYFGNKWGRAVS